MKLNNLSFILGRVLVEDAPPAAECVKKESLDNAFSDIFLRLRSIRNSNRSFYLNEAISSNSHLEGICRELRSGRQKIREDILGMRSEMRLQKVVEKGKIRDETLERDFKLQRFGSKVDGEMGNCLASMEKLRHDIFYSLSGFFFTSAAALLGYLRFFS